MPRKMSEVLERWFEVALRAEKVGVSLHLQLNLWERVQLTAFEENNEMLFDMATERVDDLKKAPRLDWLD